MIDIATEDLFPLSELPDHWPPLPGGRRLHRSVGYRYAKDGVGPNRTRLETVIVGSIRYTSTEAVQRFCEQLTAEQDEGQKRNTTRPTRREQTVRRRRAARALDDAGI